MKLLTSKAASFLQSLGVMLLIALAGCHNLKPESVDLPDYPDLEAVYVAQYQSLHDRSFQKEVTLGGDLESGIFQLDSTRWKEELSFMKELNPRKPEFVGSYRSETNGNIQRLALIDGEKSALKALEIETSSTGEYLSIQATIHENKEVFIHHRDVLIAFENGTIGHWNIHGYQKMLMGDTVRFTITGNVK